MIRPTVLVVAAGAAAALSGSASAATAFGLSLDGQRLVSFDTGAVQTILANNAITGLNTGESLLAIDARPATGELFALSNQSRLYRVGTNGAATLVPLSGTAIPALNGAVGMDFNPAVDRIRVVTSTGQNLRLNPNTGALAADDGATFGAIRYDATDPSAGLTPRITSVAYTNSPIGGPAPGATNTTLYGIDVQGQFDRRLVTQGSINSTPVSPNEGRLFGVAGIVGIFVGDLFGFDILTSGGVNSAFLSGQTISAGTAFYTLDLTTGSTVFQGNIGNGLVGVRDFTVVPAPAGAAALGLGGLLAMRRRRA